MWRRLSSTAFAALIISAIITGTAWAAFAWSSYTGPTIIQDNGNGTWNVQWTIVVTTLSQDDKTVCVSVTPEVVPPSICGTTTGTLTCTLSNVPNNTQLSWDISSFTANNGCTGNKTLGPFGTISPLAVTLATFAADATGDGVTLAWETVSEQTNAGFNLYRSEAMDGEPALLAFVPAGAPGSSQGNNYSYRDADVVAGATYWYWLADVDLAGATTLHEPVVVTVGTPNAVGLASFGATAAGPSLAGLAALALVALAGAGARRRR